MFRDAKCGVCKPKLGIYKPNWAVRRIGCNFAASIWASARIDCEVDASFYEVSLHGWWRGINFAASMSAGRVLKSLMVNSSTISIALDYPFAPYSPSLTPMSVIFFSSASLIPFDLILFSIFPVTFILQNILPYPSFSHIYPQKHQKNTITLRLIPKKTLNLYKFIIFFLKL